MRIRRALDISFGEGHDLTVLCEYFPKASLSAIDHKDIHLEKLKNFEIAAYRLNIGKESYQLLMGHWIFLSLTESLSALKKYFVLITRFSEF